MAKYQILSWHGIPVQVRVRDKNGRMSKELPPRFIDAVDRAAMLSKKSDSESYTNGFQWSDPQEREGSAQDVADALLVELEKQYPEIDYRAVAEKLKAQD